MFGRKTRELKERVEALEIKWLRADGRLGGRIDALEARIRALEEATKPKSGRVKK